MLKNLLLWTIAGTLFATYTSITTQTSGELVLRFEDLRATAGTIEIAIFNSEEDFLQEGQAMKVVRIPVHDDQVTATINDLPYGTYAVTSYHDINDNNEFDRNFLGVPKEPVAVSRMYTKKWRKPRFGEAHFSIAAPEHEERMKFIKF